MYVFPKCLSKILWNALKDLHSSPKAAIIEVKHAYLNRERFTDTSSLSPWNEVIKSPSSLLEEAINHAHMSHWASSFVSCVFKTSLMLSDVSLTRYGSYELGCPQSYCVQVVHMPLTESPRFLFFHTAVPRVTAASSPLSSKFCSYPDHRQTLSGSPPYSTCGIYKWDVPNANCIKGPLSLNHLVSSHFTSPSTVAHRSPHQPTYSALIPLSIS